MEGTQAQSGNTTKKWLIGCGIGCGVIVIIVAVLIAAGFFFFKNIVDEFKDTEAMMSTLTERYGRIEDFCPEPEGSIKPERLQAFLEAREAYAPVRVKISQSLDALSKGKDSGDVEIKKPKNVVKMIRLGFGIIPQIAEFIKTRNQALLNVEMGIGEYYYLYVIIYYSWLKKQPEDGPDFQIIGSDYEEDRFRYWDMDDIKEERRERMLRRTNRMILPMMRCQLQKIERQNAGQSLEQWRMALRAEIKAMEEDNERLPWQDGVPDILNASLGPFKTRLEASYLPTTNPLEMVLEHR